MRIGITGGSSSVDKMIDQAVRSEAEGFFQRDEPFGTRIDQFEIGGLLRRERREIINRHSIFAAGGT